MSWLLQSLTAIIAVGALINSYWQAHRARLLARQANAGPVLASTYSQFRDRDFRKAIETLRTMPKDHPFNGFSGLQGDSQEAAYTVCYYFEYMGLLVSFGHLDRSLVLESMSTQLVELWQIMQPWIIGEREVRANVKDQYRGKRFLPHYEHLVALIAVERSGSRDNIGKDKLYFFMPTHPLFAGRSPQLQRRQVSLASFAKNFATGASPCRLFDRTAGSQGLHAAR